ncbi:hypothetical protein [Nioella nitratireducens]|uniref:hypothetical protein n=2 Tax=Nioella TaxID=1775424 RepID=UPI0008FCF16D|nr:hypothetical protein [Nioella nitratireducens]
MSSADQQSDPRDIILIFQMAKVASRSWAALMRETCPDALISHFHAISAKRLEKIAKVVAAKPPVQTIKHLTIPRLGRPQDTIAAYVKDGQWHGPPATIISGVRDPVARALSAVGFLCNRLGYTPFPVTPRDSGSPENILKIFHRALDAARNGDDGSDTLITLLAGIIGDFDIWFEEELHAPFGLDIRTVPFDHTAQALRVYGRNQALVYRMEDLKTPEAHAKLLRAAGALFGKPMPCFPDAKVAHEQRYQALYAKVTQSLQLSPSDLDWFYENATMAHFYTPQEIDGFRRRWAR